MSNARSKSNNAARNNNARPTANRKAQQTKKRKQPPMAASNKWMLILGLGFVLLRLIFPDVMAILGSTLGGLTIVAVAAVVISLVASFYEQSVPDFIANLFGGLMGFVNGRMQKRQARRVSSKYEEYVEDDEYDDDDLDDVYDDYDDYDDTPVVEAVIVEDEEPQVPQMRRHRRPVVLHAVEEDEQVPQGTFDDTPKKPEIDVPEGFELKLEDGKWAIRPMTPPDIDVPDGFEFKLEGGKWKLVPKA